MQRWNEETGRLEPFSPGEREYPPLSLELAAQLDSISITTHTGVTYRPCRVSLLDGKFLDCVFLVDAQEYIKVWGMWPDQDEDKGEVLIGDVVRIEPSPYCLPARFAQRLYDAGESGMGHVQFEIVVLLQFSCPTNGLFELKTPESPAAHVVRASGSPSAGLAGTCSLSRCIETPRVSVDSKRLFGRRTRIVNGE